MKNLIIVESPNKVKKIQSFLDPKEYKVISSVGHIRDLKKYGTALGLGIKLEEMEPIYENLRNKKDVIKVIIDEAKKAENIYLATDPDREGEAISWHIQEIIKTNITDKDFNIYRIFFNEITKSAVLSSFEHADKLNMHLVDSQEARRMLDRIIGFRLSFLTKKKVSAPSAGRVKSSTLKLIIDRENEIKNFVPDYWWVIEPKLSKEEILTHIDKNNKAITFKEEKDAKTIHKNLTTKFIYKESNEKLLSIPSPVPLEMASYLMAMFSNFRLSNLQATSVAQSLYEKGLITYPRTDSTRISSGEFIQEAKAYIEKKYPNHYQGLKINKNKSKNMQDAHEAIRPTDINKDSNSFPELNSYEKKVYDFIRNITLKSLMKNGKNKIINSVYSNNDELFNLKYSYAIELGFRIIDKDNYSTKEPKIKKELIIKKENIILAKHQTTPPPHYNQASIINKLKAEGIGRPSTYAVTTTGLINFGYINKEKGSLIPTEFAYNVNDLLLQSFDDIINEKYTAKMESVLDEIALGKVDSKKYLLDFWKIFEPRIENADKTIEAKKPEYVNRKCPKCKTGDLIYKNSRYGKFIGCSNYPDCDYIESLKPTFEPIKIGQKCPECGEGELIIRKSRYNTYFIGCSNYPKCKYIMNKKEAEPIIKKFVKES